MSSLKNTDIECIREQETDDPLSPADVFAMLGHVEFKCCFRDCLRKIRSILSPSSTSGTASLFCAPCAVETTSSSSSSSRSSVSSVGGADLFIQFVSEVRGAGFDQYRPKKTEAATDAATAASNKACTTYIMEHFKSRFTETISGRRKYNYDVLHPTLGPKPLDLCQTAFLALNGVGLSKLEYAFELLKNGHSTEARIMKATTQASGEEHITIEQAFEAFGLDYSKMQRQMQAFCQPENKSFNDTPRQFIALAWLAGEIEAIGSQEPNEEWITLDPVDIRELWQEYKEDTSVRDEGNILSYQVICSAQLIFIH